jgi:carbamoyl-phosphate synthase large subunit
VPYVSKATGVQLAKIAARLMTGRTLKELLPEQLAGGKDLSTGEHFFVKSPVFPWGKFQGVDPVLGPEMRSTGEVMGLDVTFGRAFAKSQIGAGAKLPLSGTAFISVKETDKEFAVEPAKHLLEMGFDIIATRGTAKYLVAAGLEVRVVNKVLEGRPHIVDALKNGQVQLVFNTTEGVQALADSLSIRRTALQQKVPYYTTIAGAAAATQAIAALKEGSLEVASLQSYSL